MPMNNVTDEQKKRLTASDGSIPAILPPSPNLITGADSTQPWEPGAMPISQVDDGMPTPVAPQMTPQATAQPWDSPQYASGMPDGPTIYPQQMTPPVPWDPGLNTTVNQRMSDGSIHGTSYTPVDLGPMMAMIQANPETAVPWGMQPHGSMPAAFSENPGTLTQAGAAQGMQAMGGGGFPDMPDDFTPSEWANPVNYRDNVGSYVGTREGSVGGEAHHNQITARTEQQQAQQVQRYQPVLQSMSPQQLRELGERFGISDTASSSTEWYNNPEALQYIDFLAQQGFRGPVQRSAMETGGPTMEEAWQQNNLTPWMRPDGSVDPEVFGTGRPGPVEDDITPGIRDQNEQNFQDAMRQRDEQRWDNYQRGIPDYGPSDGFLDDVGYQPPPPVQVPGDMGPLPPGPGGGNHPVTPGTGIPGGGGGGGGAGGTPQNVDQWGNFIGGHAADWMNNPSRYDASVVQQGMQVIEDALGRIRDQSTAGMDEYMAGRGLVGSSVEAGNRRALEEEIGRIGSERAFNLLQDQARTFAQDRGASFGPGFGMADFLAGRGDRSSDEEFRRWAAERGFGIQDRQSDMGFVDAILRGIATVDPAILGQWLTPEQIAQWFGTGG